ncbi:MAG: 30S ribosomal protein S18 [Candidatus Paceibacterota bacterium]
MTCYFHENADKTIDYKNTETLEKFLNQNGRIKGRRWTGVCSKHQRALSRAIKQAREMALLPFVIR